VVAHIEQMEACVRAVTSEPEALPKAVTPLGMPSAEQAKAHEPSQAPGPIELQRQASGALSAPAGVPPASGRRLEIAGVTLGAAGLVTLGAAVVANLRMAAIQDQVSNQFQRGGPATPAIGQLIADGRMYQTVTRILYAGSAVMLATGAGLYFWGSRRQPHQPQLLTIVTGSKDHGAVSLVLSYF